MNKAFISFQESTLASGIKETSPFLAQDLRTIAARFNELTQNLALGGVSDGSHPRPDLSAGVYDLQESIHDSQMAQDIVGQNQADTHHSSAKPNHKANVTTQVWGYEVGEEGIQVEQEMQNPQPITINYGSSDISADLNWFAQSTTLYHAQIPEMQSGTQSSIPRFNTSLAPPSTYSFHESTFARRLARAAFERSHRMLTDPNSRMEDMHNIFRFSFCFNNAKNVAKFVKNIVSRDKDQSLDLWQAPQLHLGDAGLHYPRQLEHDVPSYWADKAPMGPRRSAKAETPVPDWMTIEQIIEITGFQGEWFDPHDVEQYLRSKGLQLDAQSTWLELDIDEVPRLETTQPNAATSAAESYPGTDPSSPRNAEPRYLGEPVVLVPANPSNVELAGLRDAFYMDPNVSLTDPLAKTRSIGSDLTYDTGSVSGRDVHRKMVDVEKFIDSEYPDSLC